MKRGRVKETGNRNEEKQSWKRTSIKYHQNRHEVMHTKILTIECYKFNSKIVQHYVILCVHFYVNWFISVFLCEMINFVWEGGLYYLNMEVNFKYTYNSGRNIFMYRSQTWEL